MISPLGLAARMGLLFMALGTAQTLLPQIWTPLGLIDTVMIAVGLIALRVPFAQAVLAGAAAGLIQDSLAGGLIGLHAFSKTAVAAAIALLADFLAVRGQLAEAAVIALATGAEAVIVSTLLAFLGWPSAESLAMALPRAGLTGLACGMITVGAPRLQAGWQRWRRGTGLRWR